MVLIALDFPEFERPANATSMPLSGRNWPGAFALRTNFACGYCDMGYGTDVCIIQALRVGLIAPTMLTGGGVSGKPADIKM